MRYKAILFDMDGTVLDTLRDLNAAANRALAEFGFPPMTIDDTRRRVGNGSRRLLELSLPEGADASFFLCKELVPGYLSGITGEYVTPQCYFVAEREPDAFAAFDALFPRKEKLKLPGQIF